jgi:hypothetical protein
LLPETLVVPLTARVGVEEPDSTTLLTDVGVIAPRVRLMAGVVVEVATVPDTPFAVVTDTLVTVPPPDALRVEPDIDRPVPSVISATADELALLPTSLLVAESALASLIRSMVDLLIAETIPAGAIVIVFTKVAKMPPSMFLARVRQ